MSDTIGYEAESTDVDALLADVMTDINEEPDPSVRYVLLSKAGVLYDALVSRIADERARVAAEMWDEGRGLSYAKLADALSLGSRSRAQQLVERGRALPTVRTP